METTKEVDAPPKGEQLAHKSWGSVRKFEVRDTVIDFFRSITGMTSIPQDRCCLALCGKQENKEGFQVHQYVTAGLIQPGQFVGVDRSQEVVDFNSKQHPLPTEFVQGEWGMKFPELLSRRPMLIDLDTTSVATTQEAIKLAAQSLRLAQPRTLVSFNAALKHPYRPSTPKVDLDEVLGRIAQYVPGSVLRNWIMTPATFNATTRRTPMQTFLFYRPESETHLAA